MDTNFNKMTEENTYTPPTTTPSEDTWNGMQDVLPLATETQDESILSVPPPIEPNPLGDVLCPLLLLAASYLLLLYIKATKNRKAGHTTCK